jgi:hypothetical protein
MAMNNGGSINNTGNPIKHTHGIGDLNNVSSGGQDGDLLAYSDGVWKPHEATPFVMAAGRITQATALILTGGVSATFTVNYADDTGGLSTDTKFTLPPIVVLSHSASSGTSKYLVLHVSSSTVDGFTWYAANPYSNTAVAGTITISFISIQIDDSIAYKNDNVTVSDGGAASGMVSRDPGA